MIVLANMMNVGYVMERENLYNVEKMKMNYVVIVMGMNMIALVNVVEMLL